MRDGSSIVWIVCLIKLDPGFLQPVSRLSCSSPDIHTKELPFVQILQILFNFQTDETIPLLPIGQSFYKMFYSYFYVFIILHRRFLN